MNPSSIDASWLPIKPQPKTCHPDRSRPRSRRGLRSGGIVATRQPSPTRRDKTSHRSTCHSECAYESLFNRCVLAPNIQPKQKRAIPTEAGRAPGAACAAEGSWQHANPAHLDGTKPPTDPPVTPHHPRASLAPSPYLQLAPSPPAPHFASKTKSKIAIYVGPDTLLPPTSRFTLCATTRS